VGDVIDKRYKIKGELGKGGIARVWRALDKHTGEEVAVKHLRFESGNYQRAPSKMERMFRREIEALRKVKDGGGHPNIIDLQATSSHQGTQLAIVELVEGKELGEKVSSLTVSEARQIAIDVADAMAFLHRSEVILRDLKPDNAMIGSSGVLLIDFNTAKEYDTDAGDQSRCPNCGDSLTTSDYVCPNCEIDLAGGDGTVIGNSRKNTFKPPEATEDMAHLRQGPWSDVYSLGKILHYMLTENGVVPSKHGVNPEQFGLDLGTSNNYLGEIVARATAENYGERYSNARVFAKVLENRDPDPPSKARVVHDQTDKKYAISPGDTIGRDGADGPAATITIDDPHPGGSYISAVQLQFDTNEHGQWHLRDQSLNGTYVQNGSGWRWVLCEPGRKRLQNEGKNPTDRYNNVPPEKLKLDDGAVIKLVDTSYDVTFLFEKVR